MAVSPRTSLHSSPLVRLLSDLNAVDVAEAPQTLAERLSQWLAWTDAIALSGALKASDAARTVAATPPEASAVVGMVERVRKELTTSIAKASAAIADDDADFAVVRRLHRTQQQALAGRIERLRGEVRAALSDRSPALATLARLDAVLADALCERESHLLAGVPALLEKHFQAARRSDAPAAGLRDTVQRVLLAELDTRLQPIEGMIEALGDDARRQP